MQTIDVHDLPEPVAKAIEAMVQSLRQAAPALPAQNPEPSVWQVLAPILEEAWALNRNRPHVPLQGQESEIERLIVEKFKRQGLRL